jgi:hypothetical protein
LRRKVSEKDLVVNKICGKCGEEKPANQYFKNSYSCDGLLGHCKDCAKITYEAKKDVPLQTISEKICTKCGALKSKDKFYASSISKDGLNAACVDCVQAYAENLASKPKKAVTEKPCKSCLIVKPAESFSKSKNYKDGLSAECRECRAAKYTETKNNPKPFVMSKVCGDCGENKDATFYCKKISSKDGLNSRCKDCERKDKERRYHADKGSFHARNSLRRAIKINATPKWLTKEQRILIANIFKEARRLTIENGVVYHVDHVHALKGENFSGLHVPWNLQILKGAENLSKQNKPPEGEAHLFW